MQRTKLMRKDPELREFLWYEIEEEKEATWFHAFNKAGVLYSSVLERGNNRGWTLFCYTIGTGNTQIFLSRGEWEMIDATKN